MRAGLRQSMAWLHSWSGLLVCWVLLLVFCAGTASYFKDEITLWMKPEMHRAAATPVTSAEAATRAVAFLQRNAPGSPRWFINLPDERNPVVHVLWIRAAGEPGSGIGGSRGRFESRTLDPATGRFLDTVRDTRGGEFLYRLHFDLYYMQPLWARWIIGVCAMFMLVAILSGIVTHRRIFQDFFTFRPRKGQRSWLDAHNATAVLALPFHLMITYTGLVTLMFMYMPWGVQTAYQGNLQAFNNEAFGRAPQGKPSGQAAPLVPVAPLVEQAMRHWHGAEPSRVAITLAGDANATITISRGSSRSMSVDEPSMRFDGATGRLAATSGDAPAPASQTRGVMVGLHEAHFAGPLLRALFFVSGLAGCVMVATGALLWGAKTRQQQARALAAGARPSFGLRLVDALNIGAIAGLPIAFAAYFWANRLLPVAMAQRPDAEIRWFFMAWATAAVLAQLRPTRGMWRAQLWAGALMLAGIPVLNAFTTETHLGVTLLQGQGPAAVAGFDLTTLALGVALGAAAWVLGRRKAARGMAPAGHAPAGKAARQAPRAQDAKGAT
ncbi:PepSY-associated TM helix domain-containing protein [Cupriavidus sp. 30B13]|uniref:PepSY-associated TM helix domain-containing protein n=1 Tax=Cupriavidus sp. 30B13 TaxID=3384241 RepID=UPI003B91E5C9